MTTIHAFRYLIRSVLALTASVAVGMSDLVHASEPSTQFITVNELFGGLAFDESGGFRHIEMTVARQVEVPKTESGADRIQKLASANESLVSTGVLRLLVINVQLPNGAATDRTKIIGDYQAAADGIARLSRGMAQLQIEILPENYVLDVSSCEGTGGATSATSAIVADLEKRMDVSHRFISFVLPAELNCDRFAGLANWPGRFTWINGAAISGTWGKVVAHELGHNLGLGHQQFMWCASNGQSVAVTNRVDRNTACSIQEYGSPYSLMGAAEMSLTNAERRVMGWLRPGEEVFAANGTFTIDLDGAIGLLELSNTEGDVFYAEMTQPGGGYVSDRRSDGTFGYTWTTPKPGVLISYAISRSPSYSTAGGLLLVCAIIDGNPSTNTNSDATFGVGQVFIDATNTVRVEVVAMTDRTATVNVLSYMAPLNAPSGVKLQAAVGGFNATWLAVTNGHVNNYELQYSSDPTFTTGVNVVGVVGISATIGGISPKTTTWVRIAAVDQRGPGTFSSAMKTVSLAKSKSIQGQAKGKNKGAKRP